MVALGLIETVGFTTAVSAADAAVKAADVEIIGLEKVIGVNGYVDVTIHLTGDVAAVSSAVEAGEKAALKIGEIISTEVIARVHSDVNEKLLKKFTLKSDSPPDKPKPVRKTTKTSPPRQQSKKDDEK